MPLIIFVESFYGTLFRALDYLSVSNKCSEYSQGESLLNRHWPSLNSRSIMHSQDMTKVKGDTKAYLPMWPVSSAKACLAFALLSPSLKSSCLVLYKQGCFSRLSTSLSSAPTDYLTLPSPWACSSVSSSMHV